MDPEQIIERGALQRLLRIGGREFLLEMMDLFLEHAPERIRSARAALADGDHQTLYRAAHSLKSTAGNLGARGLQRVSERIEARAAQKDMEAIPPLLDELDRRFEEVRERLEDERSRHRGG